MTTRLDAARAALLASKLQMAHEAVHAAFAADLAPAPTDYASADIRVLCPRGHFIADVTVLAADTWPDITLLPELLPEGQAAPYGLAYEQPRNWTSGKLDDLLHGRILARCDVARHNYRGSFAISTLTAELAEAAAKRTTRYRLVS